MCYVHALVNVRKYLLAFGMHAIAFESRSASFTTQARGDRLVRSLGFNLQQQQKLLDLQTCFVPPAGGQAHAASCCKKPLHLHAT